MRSVLKAAVGRFCDILQGYQSALDALCALWSKSVPECQRQLGLGDVCQAIGTAVLGNNEGKVGGLGCTVAGESISAVCRRFGN